MIDPNGQSATGGSVELDGPRAYFGHHKAGSMWVLGTLNVIAREVGLRHVHVYDQRSPYAVSPLALLGPGWVSGPSCDRELLRERVDEMRVDLVSAVSADRLQAEVLRPARAFHVIRDPRDIIVSGYFSHRNSHNTEHHPDIAAHRADLLNCTQDEGLLLEMEFARTEMMQLAEWDYTMPNVLEVKFEDLTLKPYEWFLRIFEHLGWLGEDELSVSSRAQVALTFRRAANRMSCYRMLGLLRRSLAAVPPGLVLAAVHSQRFAALSGGRRQGIEDAGSHYRKGVSGDWISYFTPTHIKAFDDLYGDLVVKLGFEDANDWAKQAIEQVGAG